MGDREPVFGRRERRSRFDNDERDHGGFGGGNPADLNRKRDNRGGGGNRDNMNQRGNSIGADGGGGRNKKSRFDDGPSFGGPSFGGPPMSNPSFGGPSSSGPSASGIGGFKPSRAGMGGQSTFGLDSSAWGGPNKRYEKKILEIMGSTRNLPSLDTAEKKFSVSNKLWLGNLTSSTTEKTIVDMCKPYGEVDDIFVNKEKKFAFLKFDYKVNAEKFQINEDGREISDGRYLRVDFSSQMNGIKVKNLNPCVTNELLFKAFSIFGQVEKAKVLPNSGQRSKLYEGVVEYNNKKCAEEAIAVCREFPFVLTSSIIPVIVEPLEENDSEMGRCEQKIVKDDNYMSEREVGPRFIKPGTFDFNFCDKYRQLSELRREKELALEKEMELEEEKLCSQMEVARYDHETEMFKSMYEKREEERLLRINMLNQRQIDVERRLEMEQEKKRLRESAFDFNLVGPGGNNMGGNPQNFGGPGGNNMGGNNGQNFGGHGMDGNGQNFGGNGQQQDMRDPGFGRSGQELQQNPAINPMMGVWGQAQQAIATAQEIVRMQNMNLPGQGQGDPGMIHQQQPDNRNRSHEMDLKDELLMMRSMQQQDPPEAMWQEFDGGAGKRPRYPGEVMQSKGFGRGGKR